MLFPAVCEQAQAQSPANGKARQLKCSVCVLNGREHSGATVRVDNGRVEFQESALHSAALVSLLCADATRVYVRDAHTRDVQALVCTALVWAMAWTRWSRPEWPCVCHRWYAQGVSLCLLTVAVGVFGFFSDV